MYRISIFLVVILVLPLIAAELFLRVNSDAPLREPLYVLDPVLGWKLRANTKFIFDEEGYSEVKTNSEGFRDYEHQVPKTENVFRVVILGDSFVEAKQVAFENSLAALLQKELLACAKVGVEPEVITFAAQGYGTAQQYLLYTEYAKKYSPDLVILAFYEGNDVFDNHPNLNPSNPELAPYLISSVPSPGLVVKTKLSPAAFALREFFQNHSKHSYIAKSVFSLLTTYSKPTPAISKQEYEWALFRLSEKKEIKQAWSDTLALIVELRSQVLQDGAKFRLLNVPVAISVHPDSILQNSFLRQYGVSDFSFVQKQLSSTLPKQDLFFFRDELDRLAKKSGKALYGFSNSRLGYGHLNELGHKALSRELSARVCELL